MSTAYRVPPRDDLVCDSDAPQGNVGVVVVLSMGFVASGAAVLAGLAGDGPWRTEHTGALFFMVILGAGLREPLRRWLAARRR